MKVLDLNAVISDAEAMVRRTLGNDIRMTAVFASSLGPIRADAGKLQQVILRLVAHARQAMPTGGRFTIETKNVRLDRASNPNARSGAYVLLTLSDTSTGLNEAALQRVFDPALDPASHSADHGLEMSHIPEILHRFGGYIQTECQPSAGTVFKIFLPRCDDLISKTGASRHPLGIPTGRETILLVDDEDSVRSLLRILLQSSGYHVLEAVSGDEAISVAENHPGPIDLLITDVMLPRVNGKVLVKRLLALQPAMKVLLISGYSSDRITSLDCGSRNFAFLQKPFKCDVIGNLVRQLLDRPKSPEYAEGIG